MFKCRLSVLSEGIDRIMGFFWGEEPSESTESQTQLWHQQCLKLDSCQVLGPRLLPWICVGRQEDPWKVCFGNQIGRSSPCGSRQEISKRSQMANELMFILSREKKTGDRPSFTAAKPRPSSADTNSTWAAAWAASRGRFSLPSFASPHMRHTAGPHRSRADYLPWKIQPKGIFGQGKSRFLTVSQRGQQLIAVKAKPPLKIRDHPRCIRRQGRSAISRNHNCTLHNPKY